MRLIRQRVTIVWILLMTATCASTWMFSKDAFSPEVAVVGTFLLSALKARFVMLDFMELREAPVGLRVVFESWIAVVTLVILGFWFATPSAA